MHITLSRGIPTEMCKRVAQLYDIAFGEKLALAVPDHVDRIKLLSNSMQLQYSIGAFDELQLVGLAGYSTSDGSLTGGIDYRGLLSELGWIKGNRAAAVLGLYERKARTDELLMDGIVVDPDYRGNGIGSKLFADLIELATAAHYSSIRLDVVDTNTDAKRLYERLGFQAERTVRFEFLRDLLGFGASTTMIYRI